MGKGFYALCCGIALKSLEKGSKVILCTASPVFQSKTVFDGKNDLSARFQMTGNGFQKIHIRGVALNIVFPILKNADQSNVIILLRQRRLDLLKISHKYCEIFAVLMSPGIDLTSFF